MDGLILAGDVGGTKTHLGLFKQSSGALELVRDHRYATADFDSLEAVCATFLGAGAAVKAVCMGVPGPIIDGGAHASNVAWLLSSTSLSRALNGAPVRLINDLTATAYGMVHLKPAEFAVCIPRKIRQRMAISRWWPRAQAWAKRLSFGRSTDITRWHPRAVTATSRRMAPSRSSCCDFSPANSERQLRARPFGPGPLEYLSIPAARERGRRACMAERGNRRGRRAGRRQQRGAAGRDPVCVHALTMFCDIYGSEAANLALKVLALGGVFLGGGSRRKFCRC